MKNYLFALIIVFTVSPNVFAAQKDVVILLPKIGALKPAGTTNKDCMDWDKFLGNAACTSASVAVQASGSSNDALEKVAVKLKEIKKFLQDTRKQVCDAIKPASISMSMAATEEGNLVFVSGSLEVGFTVTIECK